MADSKQKKDPGSIRVSPPLLAKLRKKRAELIDQSEDGKGPTLAQLLDEMLATAQPGVVELKDPGGSTDNPLPTDTLAELTSLSKIAWDLADRLGNLVVTDRIKDANQTAARVRAQRHSGGARPDKRQANPKGSERSTGT